MKQIFDDLWKTELHMAFGSVPTHAWLLRTAVGNVLVYNTPHAQDLDHMETLGGVDYQLLSHRDDVGDSLSTIKERFGARLGCHEEEEPLVRPYAAVDELFTERALHPTGIEVIPTPGHTGGSLSFLYSSPNGRTYLFTGDNLFRSGRRWSTLVFTNAGGSDAGLRASLKTYRTLNPSVVISSACGDVDDHLTEVTPEKWQTDMDDLLNRRNE